MTSTGFGIVTSMLLTGALAGAAQAQTVTGVSPSSGPPTVFLATPQVLGSTRAALSGTINPDGLATTAFFQYGTDLRYRGPGASEVLYDHSTPPAVASDSTSREVSASISGLVPNAVYHVRLFGGNSDGSVDGPDVTFMTRKDPPPPRPTLGRTETAWPVSGQLFVSAGKAFLPLTEPHPIASGTKIDALDGTLRLIAAAGTGKTQSGVFRGGVFRVSQTGSGSNRGLTTLSLVEGGFKGAPSYATCKSAARRARASHHVLQRLQATAHGSFRTRGRYGVASATGSAWSIADRCDGSIARVTRGAVRFMDFVRHTTVTVHSGHAYFAAASKAK